MSEQTSETSTDAPTEEAPKDVEAGEGATGESYLETAETAPKAPSRTVVRSLGFLCVVLLVATVAMAVVAARERSDLQRTRDTRSDVEQVASRFASAVLTYDYRDLDKTKASVLALSAGKFRTDYERNFEGLKALFTSTEGQSTATVKDVFVSAIENDTATAIVVLDERGQGKAGQRLNVDWYLRLSLVRVKGEWKVDDLTNLNFAGQAATPVPGATPTTTPAK